MSGKIGDPDVQEIRLKDDGKIPNSSLPLLVYRKVLKEEDSDLAAHFEESFSRNRWTDSWRNGVYPYHHYHSQAHEVLGIFSGAAKICFGGEAGETIDLSAGDAVVIPAGVAHKNLGSSDDFGVVGAYPEGQSADICKGADEERPAADERIRRVPVPETDPLYGESGPLRRIWS